MKPEPKDVTPEPKPPTIICTLCGLDWHRHTSGKAKTYKVKAEDCVELLKHDLRRASVSLHYSQTSGLTSASVSGIPLHGNQIGRAS